MRRDGSHWRRHWKEKAVHAFPDFCFLPCFPLHLLMLEGKGEPFICSTHSCRERYSRHLVVSVLAVPAAAAVGNDPNHHNGSNNSPNDASVQSYVHGCCMGREELAGKMISNRISTITGLQVPTPDPDWVEATFIWLQQLEIILY